MNRRVVRIVLVCSVLSFLTLAAAWVLVGQGGLFAPPATKIMPLGDSITEGHTVPGGYRVALWQECISRNHRIDFVGSLANGPPILPDHDHEGHSAWRIDQIDAHMVEWLDTYQPDVVLLLIGTNDVLQHYNLDAAPERLQTLMNRITGHAPNTLVLVASVPPMDASTGNSDLVRAYNAAIPPLVAAQRAAGHNVEYVDIYSVLAPDDFADSVHPNATGYTKIAQAWYAVLARDVAEHDHHPQAGLFAAPR